MRYGQGIVWIVTALQTNLVLGVPVHLAENSHVDAPNLAPKTLPSNNPFRQHDQSPSTNPFRNTKNNLNQGGSIFGDTHVVGSSSIIQIGNIRSNNVEIGPHQRVTSANGRVFGGQYAYRKPQSSQFGDLNLGNNAANGRDVSKPTKPQSGGGNDGLGQNIHVHYFDSQSGIAVLSNGKEIQVRPNEVVKIGKTTLMGDINLQGGDVHFK